MYAVVGELVGALLSTYEQSGWAAVYPRLGYMGYRAMSVHLLWRELGHPSLGNGKTALPAGAYHKSFPALGTRSLHRLASLITELPTATPWDFPARGFRHQLRTPC